MESRDAVTARAALSLAVSQQGSILISSGQRKVTPRASVSHGVPGREAGSGPRPKADRASAPEGHQGREFGFVLNSSK